MRVNPRTVILEALQERPLPLTGGNFTFSLAASVWLECFDGLERGWKRAYAGALPTLQRHLCHLIRSRQVVRLEDGRYSLPKKRLWPGRALYPGEIEIRVLDKCIKVPVAVGEDSVDVAGHIHDALREVNPGNVFCPPEYRR